MPSETGSCYSGISATALTTTIITALSTYMNQTKSLLDAANTFYHAMQMLMSFSLNASSPAKNQTLGFFPEDFWVSVEGIWGQSIACWPRAGLAESSRSKRDAPHLCNSLFRRDRSILLWNQHSYILEESLPTGVCMWCFCLLNSRVLGSSFALCIFLFWAVNVAVWKHWG